MGIRDQKYYKELVEQIDESRKSKVNLLIVTLPGMGITRVLKEYQKEKNDREIALIMDPSDKLLTYNLINFDWNHQDTPNQITTIVKKADLEQRFVITVNYPGNMERLNKEDIYFLTHIYRRHYFGSWSFEDTKQMIKELKPQVDAKEIKEIYEKSGGIAQLIKVIISGAGEEEIGLIISPLIEAIRETNKETLTKLGIIKDGKLISNLLEKSMSQVNNNSPQIRANFDLSFEEDGRKNRERLTAAEKKIIEKTMTNNGQISKEEISDIKWGEGKYEKYSDQAIKKQVLRLGNKLTRYKFVAITGVGYKLVSSENVD